MTFGELQRGYICPNCGDIVKTVITGSYTTNLKTISCDCGFMMDLNTAEKNLKKEPETTKE